MFSVTSLAGFVVADLRKIARDKECQVRLLGVCNRDPSTVVLAHVRLAGVTGAGQKSPDLLASWACSECHRVTEAYKGDDQIQRAFLEGVIRTQYRLIKDGILKW